MDKTQIFKLGTFPWPEYEYKPATSVIFHYNDEGFQLHFQSYESPVRAVETKMNTPVCRDSCVEFFAQFDPKNSPDYIPKGIPLWP